MTDHDENVSRRYAELAREEPGAAIDRAILGASRRALERTPWSRRWAGPVSIAAVLVLAVGVTLEMQREQPGIERPETAPPAPRSAAPAQAPPEVVKERAAEPPPPAPERKAPRQAKDRKLERFAEPKPFADAAAPRARVDAGAPPPEARSNVAPGAREEAGAPAASADALSKIAPVQAPASAAAPTAQAPMELQKSFAAPAPAPQPLGMVTPRAKRDAAGSAPSAARLQVARTEEEVELERIAKLRADGRHDDADKALAEFRRRHPDFRIPEATWERVRPR